MTATEELVALLRRSKRSPGFFFDRILKAKLRTWQAKLCSDISSAMLAGNQHPRVLARTCHGAGKGFFAAGIGLWWMATRPQSRGLTTAPTWAGVENLLWPEIHKLYNGSLLRTLGFGRLLDTKFEVQPSWYIVGASSDRPENLEGHHSPVGAIRIVDEAKAVDDDVITATSGMLDAPETFDLWISTPSIPSGAFHRRDIEGGDEVIRAVVTLDDLIVDRIPGKAAKKAEWLSEWGEESPEYQSRALARYVSDAEGALFPFAWCERAMSADWTVEGKRVAGFDVAGSKDGDESVVAVAVVADDGRRHVVSINGWRERDTMQSKGRAIQIADGATLRVDCIGIGHGVRDAIAEAKYPNEEYRASDAPIDTTRFANRKAEDAWAMRRMLEKGLLRLPPDRELKKQLVDMKYEITAAGKIKVKDPKDSPDRVDACLIAVAPGRSSSLAGWLELYPDTKEASA